MFVCLRLRFLFARGWQNRLFRKQLLGNMTVEGFRMLEPRRNFYFLHTLHLPAGASGQACVNACSALARQRFRPGFRRTNSSRRAYPRRQRTRADQAGAGFTTSTAAAISDASFRRCPRHCNHSSGAASHFNLTGRLLRPSSWRLTLQRPVCFILHRHPTCSSPHVRRGEPGFV